MKNIKKILMPLSAMAATSAVIAPLMTITACSSYNMKSFDFVKDKFDYKGGTSGIQSACTRSTATTEYLGALEKNPELFVQDYANYLFNIDGGVEQSPEVWQEYKVSISTPVIGSTKVAYPGEESATYPTISFKIRLETTYEYENDLGIITNQKQVGELTYNNVPFFAYIGENGNWRIGVKQVFGLSHSKAGSYTYILQYMDDKWSINGSFDQTTTYTYDSIKGYKDVKKLNKTINLDSYEDIVALKSSVLETILMDYESRYLETVDSSWEISADYENNGWTFGVNQAMADASVKLSGLTLTRPLRLTETPNLTVAAEYKLPLTINGTSGYYLHINKGAKLVLEDENAAYGKISGQSLTIESNGTGKEVQIENADGTAITTLAKTIYENMTATLPKTIKLQDGENEPFTIPTNRSNANGVVVPTMEATATKEQTVAIGDLGSTVTTWAFGYKGTCSPVQFYNPNTNLKPNIAYIDVLRDDTTYHCFAEMATNELVNYNSFNLYLASSLVFTWDTNGNIKDFQLSAGDVITFTQESTTFGYATTDFIFTDYSLYEGDWSTPYYHAFVFPTAGYKLTITK